MSRAEAGNCMCGIAVSLHFDDVNRMKGCKWAAQQTKPVDRHRLFGLKLKKNFEARQDAKRGIKEKVSGGWVVGYSARIGGAVRGRVVTAGTRHDIESAIDEHYNEQMLAYVENRTPEKF